jgi:surfeit locus 1 family protein
VSLKTLKFTSWLLTLLAIVGIALTARLGYWQLSRANEKIALQTAIQQQTALPALGSQVLLSTKEISSHLHRTVNLSGNWLEQHTLFLDNRQIDGKPGFYVLTPFEFEDKALGLKKTILVQRGWVARNFLDRQQLPQIKTPLDVVSITGRVAASPSRLYEFKGADTGKIRQNVSIAELAQEFKIDLLDVTLLQTEDVQSAASSDGLLRHWPLPNLGVEKHYGYMFQWWALSALIAILYVWLQLIRPRLRASQKNND